MEEKYFADQVFEKIDFTTRPFEPGEYDNCTFSHCHFADVIVARCRFTECTFDHCNLSMAIVAKVSLQDTSFKDCKMIGLRFDECSPFLFTPSFTGCMLDLCSFFKCNLKKLHFNSCSLKDADFSEADLSHAVVKDCNLEGAVFDNTNLEKADLRGSYHFSIDPAKNRIRQAKVSKESLEGLLDRHQLVIE